MKFTVTIRKMFGGRKFASNFSFDKQADASEFMYAARECDGFFSGELRRGELTVDWCYPVFPPTKAV